MHGTNPAKKGLSRYSMRCTLRTTFYISSRGFEPTYDGATAIVPESITLTTILTTRYIHDSRLIIGVLFANVIKLFHHVHIWLFKFDENS